MSYDVWLEMDTGGPEPAQVTESVNHTVRRLVAAIFLRLSLDRHMPDVLDVSR